MTEMKITEKKVTEKKVTNYALTPNKAQNQGNPGITKTKGYIFLLLTFTLWGSLYVVSKYTLGKLPVFTISFLRFLFAFAALSVIDRHPGKELEKRHYPYILMIGFGGYFIAVGAQLLGTKYAGASTASLLNSMNPVTMSIFGALLLHEPLTGKKISGIILSIIGVFIILGGGFSGAGTAGIIFSLFAVLFWSFISVMTRKITQNYAPLHISRLACGVAAICYLPAALIESSLSHTNVVHILTHDASCTLALLYMGIVCTGAAYTLWNQSLSILDASVCAAFYPIQPAVSTLLGILLLGETLTANFLIGSALIVCGVLISLR